MRRRTIFLLGAGAALPWNGPKTSGLTDDICRVGFKNGKGNCITQEIYDWLKSKGFNANFETIINVIEDFVEFWSSSDTNQINGLSYFTEKQSAHWNNFVYFNKFEERGRIFIRIPDTNPQDYHHKIEVPEGETPEKVFLETLLVEVIDSIISAISEYSLPNIVDGDNNIKINEVTKNYFAKLSSNSLLRVYTLNYDRIPQSILNKTKIDFTEGLSPTLEGLPQPYRQIISSRILKKTEENCVYHMHGSAFWEVVSDDLFGTDYYRFIHGERPQLLSKNSSAWVELEKGKTILVSNIISGYRKVQRTGLSPFRQIFSAFDIDAHFGDELLIIGYSFGDEHINDIIRKAKAANPKLIIKIVNPSLDIMLFRDNFVRRWINSIDELECKEEDGKISFLRLNLTIYKMGFKEFMCYEMATTNQPNKPL